MLMNYFELFNIPVSLAVDPALIKKKFYELSREFHPDFFTNSGEEAKMESLGKSSMVNKAYRVFNNPDETIKYVLKLKGLLEEEEKYSLKPDFLMEVMEINEGLMDLELDPNPALLKKLEEKSRLLLKEMYDEVAGIIGHYREGVTSFEDLLLVKEYYFRKKYLNRILERISGMSNIAPRGERASPNPSGGGENRT